MATIEERSKMIQASIARMAEQQAGELNKQRDQYRKNALNQAENEVLQELYSRIQDEVSGIRGDATRAVAKQEAVARQHLLLRREEIASAVFQKVKTKLSAYTKTEEYKEFMHKLAKEMATKYPLEGSIVLLKRDDYYMAAEMDKIFSEKCRIMADENIRIGGIKLMNQSIGIFVDETLDGRLEEQKPWFYSHSGLSIT